MTNGLMTSLPGKVEAKFVNNSWIFVPNLAETSVKIASFSLANFAPSSGLTALLYVRKCEN